MRSDMRILVTGRNGQLGFELRRSLAPLGELVAIGHDGCDFLQPDQIRACIKAVKPDVIVNPAAYTAVDKAENDQDLAFAVNAIAPGILAEEANKAGALLVHYSTDYVFNGEKKDGYVELDQTDPKNIYGQSKREGELAILKTAEKALVLRTSWVFGAHGHNFVKTILRLAAEKEQLNIVADQHGTPTSAALIADMTAQLLGQYCGTRGEAFPYGLYHLAADGVTTWHEYACHVTQKALEAGKSLKLDRESILAINSDQYSVPAFRPRNSKLNTNKLKTTFGLHVPHWQQGLDHVLTLLLG